MSTNFRLVMIGAGGHARVLENILHELGYELDGYVAASDQASRLSEDVRWIGNDETLLASNPEGVLLINGVGSAGVTKGRTQVFENYKKQGFDFLQMSSLDSIVSETALLEEGVQVMPGAIIHTDARVAANSIINTGAILEHHSEIGESCHVATGATICGDVVVGDRTHIGAGATVIQGVSIGSDCVIGAGAVVIANIESGQTVVGVPAKPVSSKG